jgi:hypothetical protein
MNNWVNQHKVKVLAEHDPYWGEDKSFEAVPVSALEELFSKDGEQLAREMYPTFPITYPGSEARHYNSLAKQEGFLEAYNLQQVKIDALKEENEGKDLQIDALTDTIAQLQGELFEAVNNPNYKYENK